MAAGLTPLNNEAKTNVKSPNAKERITATAFLG
jgi:hypothetical protein